MKRFIVAIALCLVCAFSVFAQTATQERIPTVYVANDRNGDMAFTDAVFVFDTLTGDVQIVISKMAVYDGDFQANVSFYGDDSKKLRDVNVTAVGSADRNTYTIRDCKAIPAYLLHGKGSIKIEIALDKYMYVICIVLCDTF